MPWTDEQWAMFVSVMQRGFAARDPFTPADENVYRLLLNDTEPDAAIEALRQLVLEGQELRPRPGAIVKRAASDPGRPTFDEAYHLIFGPHGVLAARPGQRQNVPPRPPSNCKACGGTRFLINEEQRVARRCPDCNAHERDPRAYLNPTDQRNAVNHAAAQVASQLHPLIGSFVAAQGIDRLRALAVDDPEWGEKRRADLRTAWEQHVDTWDGRRISSLASRGRKELRQMDPMAALAEISQPRLELEEETSG